MLNKRLSSASFVKINQLRYVIQTKSYVNDESTTTMDRSIDPSIDQSINQSTSHVDPSFSSPAPASTFFCVPFARASAASRSAFTVASSYSPSNASLAR